MDWFEAGEQVFGGERDTDLFPPLSNRDPQRLWLGGFGGAWAEAPDCGGPVDEALIAALEGHLELLRELWTLGLARVERRMH